MSTSGDCPQCLAKDSLQYGVYDYEEFWKCTQCSTRFTEEELNPNVTIIKDPKQK